MTTVAGDAEVAMYRQKLDKVFRPASVALVGVSGDPHRLNAAPLRILRKTGFNGRILLVNPKYDEIDGIPCYPDVASLPEPADVAMIMVPADAVPGAIDACGKRQIDAAIVLSSGFEELEGGSKVAGRLAAMAAKYRMALVGPNCEGVWSVRERAILTFGSAADRESVHHAPIAILSQSGAIAGSLSRHLQDRGVGCAYLVSVGNETCLGMLHYLDWMLKQDDVKVVLLFIEALKDGARLLDLAATARSRGIQLVALKSGNTVLGKEAVASHTGKIATPYSVYRDVLRQAGIIQVGTLSELIESAEILSALPSPPAGGRRAGVSVFSIPGGTRALTADRCADLGVPMAAFTESTRTALKAILPRFGYAGNPTDLTGQVLSQPELFADALRIVADDENTQSLIVQLANRGPRDAEKNADVIIQAAKDRALPTVVSFLGDTADRALSKRFLAEGVACARDPADAVRYLGWLYQRRNYAALGTAQTPKSGIPVVFAPVKGLGDQSEFLAGCGIGMAACRHLGPGDDIGEVCSDLRWPVAIKALPADSDHKTEKGLLALGVATTAGVESEAKRIRSAMGRLDAVLLVQEMVAAGVEAVLSVRRDADFGAVLSIGSGGVLVELFQDVAQIAVPCREDDVCRAVGGLKLGRVLAGYRGSPAADGDALIGAAMRLSAAFLANPALREVELNPIMILPKSQGVVAVDVLIKHE